MATGILRLRTRLLDAAGLVLTLMWVSASITDAGEELAKKAVPEIPTAMVGVEELVEEIIQDAGVIEDPDERFRNLSWLLYNLKAATPEQRQPVIKTLDEAARQVDDPQTLISSRESLVLYAPELAARIALRRDDQRLRDSYLLDVIPQMAMDQPERARELINEIGDPAKRAVVMMEYATVVPGSYEQTQLLLQEVAGLGWNDTYGSRTYIVAEVLSRFGGEHPTEVSGIVREYFEPREATAVLSRIAWDLSNRLDAPEAAKIFIQDALALIPQSDEPFESAINVFGKLSSTESKQVFDKYIWSEVIGGQLPFERPLAMAARFGMPQMFSYAEKLAEARNQSLANVLPRAVGRVAYGSNPDRVVEWLKSQQPSPMRGLCVAQTAWAMGFQFHPSARDEHAIGRRWLTTLTELAAEIEDDQTRWEVYDSLLTMAKDLGESGEDLRKKWWTLKQRLKQAGESGDWERVSRFEFWKFPLEEQNRRLEDQLNADVDNEEYWKNEQHGPLTTLTRIRHSSLSDAEKEQLYRRMISQADMDPLAVSQIAGELAVYDYVDALEMIWRILPAERDPRQGMGMCAYPEAPLNAAMALRWLRRGGDRYIERGDGDVIVNALWSLANRTNAMDRDAVLEELSRVFVKMEDLAEALGVARAIEDVTARMKCVGTIIATATGAEIEL